ncbi:hypothetical protein B0H13DRAFT_2127149 [Mycena leptocephala]|nr:hypothetical protein B0H13DRAFT_2127149 [Mycena leptocephala]
MAGFLSQLPSPSATSLNSTCWPLLRSMHIFLVAISAALLVSRALGQDYTTCSGTQMDWYTSVVGETPCKTYERLRQTCNTSYSVGQMNSSRPPDLCTDQIPDCCCNSIAFSLSMLCLNCQQPIGTESGYDAPVETLQHYWNASYDGTHKSHCDTPVFSNFTAKIQTAVCNQGLKIFDGLYTITHHDGSCVNLRDTLHVNSIAQANNSFTNCPTTDIASPLNNSTNPLPQASTPPNSNTSIRVNAIAIAGIVFGTVGILAALVIAGWNSEVPSDFLEPQAMDGLSPYFRLGLQGQIPPRKGHGNNPTITSSTTTMPAAELSRTETLPPAYGQEGWPASGTKRSV